MNSIIILITFVHYGIEKSVLEIINNNPALYLINNSKLQTCSFYAARQIQTPNSKTFSEKQWNFLKSLHKINMFKAKFVSGRSGYFTRLYIVFDCRYSYTLFLNLSKSECKAGKTSKLGKQVCGNWKIKTILDKTVFRLPFVKVADNQINSRLVHVCVCVSFLKLYVLFHSVEGTTEALIRQLVMAELSQKNEFFYVVSWSFLR